MTTTTESGGRRTAQAGLRELVASLPVGRRLPGERDLAARFGVARATLRAAVETLVAEGLLDRRPSSGTYVAARPLVRSLGLTSFTQDMASRGLVAGTVVLSYRTSAAGGALASALRVVVGEQVVTFSRLRSGDGIPMAVETSWLPRRYVPRLREAELQESLYEVLATRHGIALGGAHVTIEPVLPEPRARDLLEIGPAQACLLVRMVHQDVRGRVVMVASSLYRGDRYHLQADVSGAAFALRPEARPPTGHPREGARR
ncbi:GntR family transcriptional regulator [Oerskovia jenensis]|uniref:GntR family transcriptional regulator n=1 Tax=Oerskovia jenensis TaxID=162169 RepID=A0ABS2LE25_9CELL|nr:GntR family transcriptional regulator [Oerskovia jenensis]MBM7478597.1 GntR family transcriptional regulator [Oerskovia jenensis]